MSEPDSQPRFSKVELMRLIHGYHTGVLTVEGRRMVEDLLRSTEPPKATS